MLRTLIAFSVLLSGCTWCSASTAELQAKLEAAINSIRNADSAEPTLRLQLADAAEAYWVSFDSRIPALTADENAKLDRDMFPNGLGSIHDAQELVATINSAPYALRKVKEFSSRCRERHQDLKRNAGSGSVDEILGWLRAVDCYDYTEPAHYLKGAELSNGRADGPFKMQILGSALQIISDEIADALSHEVPLPR